MKLLPNALMLVSIAALSSPLAAAAVPGALKNVSSTHLATDPLLGTWSLDTSRLPMPPEQRPRSVRFTFGDAGGGKWAVHVDIVYAPGNEVHSSSMAALDGTSVAVENSPEANLVALKHPAPNVLVMALQKNGTLVSTRIYSVMPDGHNLVETEVYPGQKGLAVMKTHYFTRVGQPQHGGPL